MNVPLFRLLAVKFEIVEKLIGARAQEWEESRDKLINSWPIASWGRASGMTRWVSLRDSDGEWERWKLQKNGATCCSCLFVSPKIICLKLAIFSSSNSKLHWLQMHSKPKKYEKVSRVFWTKFYNDQKVCNVVMLVRLQLIEKWVNQWNKTEFQLFTSTNALRNFR